MKQQAFLQLQDGEEHIEQLYLLEVLVDNIQIEESKVPGYLLEPYGPLIVKAKFLDFPDLEFDQGKCPVDQKAGDPTVAGKIIAGAPKNWQIELAKDQPDFEKYPQYRVIIPLAKPGTSKDDSEDDALRVLVPQSAIVTGEGLRYVNAVLKSELDPQTLELLQKEIEDERQRKGSVSSNKICEFKFAAGKSLLFPMTPYKLIEGLRISPLYLQVTRSGVYANDKPFFTLIGQVKLLLGNSFVKAIMVAGNTKILPVSAHIEDNYPISNVFGDETGTISIFLRLSCFGKSLFEPEIKHKSSQPQSKTGKKKFSPLYSDECDRPLSSGITVPVDEKYTIPVPWRKPWDDLPEFRKPAPVLPAFYEPLPPLPSPPTPPKPFDIGELLPNLPRCSPRQPPPCYRRAGDRPLSYCTKDIEAQLQREDLTKYTQTELESELKGKQRSRKEEDSSKKNIVDGAVSSKPNSEGSPEPEFDGGYVKRNKLVEEEYNTFDGPPSSQGPSRQTNTGKRALGDKKCTCPKIPDILLPQTIVKAQCSCSCGTVKAKLSKERKIAEILQEKVPMDAECYEELETPKDRAETSHKNKIMNEEQKQTSNLNQTYSNSSTGKKKICEEQPFPKRNDIFYLPGMDSSTYIALTRKECGHDLKRYLERCEKTGEFEQIRKFIDPNPLSGFKPNKLPEEVKKALEKEVKKLEDVKPITIEVPESKTPSTIKKRNSFGDKGKKEETQKDAEKKADLKKDGAKMEDRGSTVTKPSTKGTVSSKKDQRVRAKIRASNIYEYTAGMYPGVHVGHKYCVRPLRLVPKTMGWLWNVSDLGGALKPGRGWRPGAVRRNVNNLLQEWRKTNKGIREKGPDQEMDMLMMSNKTKRMRPVTPKSQGSKKDPDTLKLNPTIHLHKKDRFYYVSMYPIKTESQEELGEEPQPIQFKIDRKHPDGRPSGDESCFSSTQSSSDSSSYEVEYIAPAAMKQKKRKIEKTHMFSQYDEDDFMPKKALKKGAKPNEEQADAGKKAEDKDKKGKKGGKKDGKKGGKKKK